MTEAITIQVGTTIDVHDIHGADWFPMYINSGLHQTTLYLKRAQLHALRCRLDEIDDTVPCEDCGGKGVIGSPDSFGNNDPCDSCADAGRLA